MTKNAVVGSLSLPKTKTTFEYKFQCFIKSFQGKVFIKLSVTTMCLYSSTKSLYFLMRDMKREPSKPPQKLPTNTYTQGVNIHNTYTLYSMYTVYTIQYVYSACIHVYCILYTIHPWSHFSLFHYPCNIAWLMVIM